MSGSKVVEVSSLVAGPAMGSLLLSLGAEVIKIEQPKTGDPARGLTRWGFLNYNFGKKSVSINLKKPEGQRILHRIVSGADIFLENMGPDVPERLGFNYAVLRDLNPRLIYCSIKGFSKDSKYYKKPAFDAVAQAMSGTMSLTGEPNGEPLRVGNPSVDLGAAAYGTIEILAALIEREKTGKGTSIELSLLDMSVYWNGYWLTYFGLTGDLPQRLGSGHLGYSPHRVFKTRDSRFVFIATLSDEQWGKLSELLGLILDEPFNFTTHRVNHRDEVETAVARAVSKLTLDEVLTSLGEEVPCAPVRTIEEVYMDNELLERGVLVEIPQNGKTARIAAPPTLSDRKGGKMQPKKSGNLATEYLSPPLGADTDSVLRNVGYSSSEIESFAEFGIIQK